jgi:hypothetical protein
MYFSSLLKSIKEFQMVSQLRKFSAATVMFKDGKGVFVVVIS